MNASKRTTGSNGGKPAASWSDSAKEATRRLFDKGDFVSLDDRIHLKHIDSRYGYIAFSDFTAGIVRVVDKRSGETTVFGDVDELIREGWVVD